MVRLLPGATVSWLDRERVGGPGAVLSPGTEDRRRKPGLVGRVGKMLRLHREAVAMPVYDPVLAAQRPVEEVAGIELESGLRRVDLHYPPARRFVHPSGKCHVAPCAARA